MNFFFREKPHKLEKGKKTRVQCQQMQIIFNRKNQALVIHGELLMIHTEHSCVHTALLPCIQVSLHGSIAHLFFPAVYYFFRVEVRNKAATECGPVCEFYSKRSSEKTVNEEMVSDEEQC